MKALNSAYNLLQLQNLAKKDPESYFEEVISHYEHFKSVLELYLLTPQHHDENLANLVSFLAQVSTYYKEEMKDFNEKLMTVLKNHYSRMNAEMRMCFCQALILIRNRGCIEATELTPLFFRLIRIDDKQLRVYLKTHIIADIKKLNFKCKNMPVNSALRALMYRVLKDDNTVAAKIALEIMIELYRKHVWRDAKTVNAIASACFSKRNKILVAAHLFFLGVDEEDEDKDSSDSEDDNRPNLKEVMASYKFNKKTRHKQKQVKRSKKAIKKSKKKNQKDVFDFSAVHMLHDPQGMAEKLLKMLTEMNEIYAIKMMVMNLISRLVGVHKLILLNFYALLLRYLKPHQVDVTKILTFAAQAAHEYVPPDTMEEVVKTIADNFVSERNSDEAITVGINAIREICARCPLAISNDLLHDIVEYKKYKNKNVSMAAASVIQLYRAINPQMLKRRFRSRPTEATKELNTLEYGALQAKSYIPGSEVLTIEPPKEEETTEKSGKNDGNESDGSWIDVSHSGDELNSDDDDNDDWEDDEEEEKEEEENSEAEEEEGENSDKESENSKNSKGSKGSKTADKKNTKNKNKETENTDDGTDKKEKATIISQTRILSQEEFKKLKAAQIAKEVQFTKGKKRKAPEEVELEGKEIVSLKDIEKLHKRPKPNKESRLATVLEGREGRESYVKKRKKKNPHSSTTQKQKNKNKAFMMVKHKVRAKQKRSFKDKQISLRNSLLKRKRMR